ncbi:MAG TPA: hypothetical protein PLI01_00450 [Nitrospira sp.]|nr:hypothetical protein [Nitrospira sp.]HNA25229.1 hypothetical protein [Nitrospira sp.]HNI17519.1 hypothetical protein [Nitrospira sp.]
MASPNTKKLQEARRLTRLSRVKIVRPAEPGPNRAERRKKIRLRPKMKAERRQLLLDIKNPPRVKPVKKTAKPVQKPTAKRKFFNRRSS